MESYSQGFQNAGIVLMHINWIQSQMSDLVILRKNQELIPDYVNNPQVLPDGMVVARRKYWEMTFEKVQEEFLKQFEALLDARDIEDFEYLLDLRNALAHSYVSLARNYIMYRPSRKKVRERWEKRLGDSSDSLRTLPIKIPINEPAWLELEMEKIAKVDLMIMSNVAIGLGISHSRVR